MTLSWGDRHYERTAETLVPASARAIAALGDVKNERVLDLGSGTGNAALEAARRGASVLAVEPAARLADVARARAKAEGLSIDVVLGEAAHIPAPDGAFDALVSVFAVIFAPDAEIAADEMLRVVRPGGRIVLTSWSAEGAIAEAGRILRAAATPPGAPPRPAWDDPAFIRALFERRGASVTVAQEKLAFEASSAAAWFHEQEENHPIWNGIRAMLSARDPAAWEDVRARSVAALEAGNEVTSGFRTSSTYFVITATRAG